MSILDEAQQLEELTVIAKSLIQYAIGLEPGIVFERHRGWWLATPEHNFVGFRFRWSGQVGIDLSLRGEPGEQFRQAELAIRPARFGYSRCTVTHADQLMPASVCIWRAHRLFHTDRSTEVGALQLADEHELGRDGWLRPRPDATNPDDNYTITRAETTAWYRDVKDFMRANRLMDPSVLPRRREQQPELATGPAGSHQARTQEPVREPDSAPNAPVRLEQIGELLPDT